MSRGQMSEKQTMRPRRDEVIDLLLAALLGAVIALAVFQSSGLVYAG